MKTFVDEFVDALDLWCISQCLSQQGPVIRCRRVSAAPEENSFHLRRALHRRRAPLQDLLSQEDREGCNRLEEEHGGDLLWNDLEQSSPKCNARALPIAAQDHIFPLQTSLIQFQFH